MHCYTIQSNIHLFIDSAGYSLMAILIKERGVNAGEVIEIPSPLCMLGRRSDCDIQDVFDGNERVSRQHSKIIDEGGKFFIEDLGSRNGTFVNGRRLAKRLRLSSGDKIEICGIGFRFDGQSNDASSSSSVSAKRSFRTIVVDHEPAAGIMASVPLGASQASSTDSALASPERKLQGLVKLLESLGRSIESDALLDNLLDGLFSVFPAADRGFVALRADDQESLSITAAKFRQDDLDQTLQISQTIADHVLESSEAVLSSDVQADNAFATSHSISEAQIRSFMCAPITNSERNTVGIVQLETLSAQTQFSPQDLHVLAAVAPQVSLSLNFSELHQLAIQRVELDRDLELARKVQLGLLPDQHPELPGYDFHDFYEAAFQVGGDYFDYIPLKNGRLAIVLADVSGKGVSASLLMAKLSGELKLYLANEESPGAAVSQLNDSMCVSGVGGRFVTMVVAVIDVENDKVTIVNAGHMAPLLRHNDGEVKEIGVDERCMAVGFFPNQEYKEYQFTVQPGESLTMFTDGFTEAVNTADELYGDQRLAEQLSRPAADLAQLGQNVLTDLRQFVGDHSQSDDMCLVSFGRRIETSAW
jgi:sigma-B regulation protein RsbU (phosphoserine phosphatase)